MDQKKRLWLAIGLSCLIFLASDRLSAYIFGHGILGGTSANQEVSELGSQNGPNGAASGATGALEATAQDNIAPSVHQPLENTNLRLDVAMTGGRIDGGILKNFTATLGEPAGYPLLKPIGPQASYIAGGWNGAVAGPDENTPWQLEGDVNGAGKPLVMVWRNTTGQSFQREFALAADGYTLNVIERVVNGAALPVSLTPYVQVHRADGDAPHERSSFVNFFGPMGVVDNVTQEKHYDKLKKGDATSIEGKGGWWGMTEQYFMTAIIPAEDATTKRQFRYQKVGERDFYSSSVEWAPVTVAAGGNAEVRYSLYIGPKHEAELQAVGHELPRAIDWGWFEIIAKPLYHGLVWLHGWLGSWALAVIALTAFLKLLTFPLANKSYHAMAKMRKLQPKIEALKERMKDDQQGMALAMMGLYKEEKVNPASGCWPMFIQIPIFFAMYKVILVSFDFRHQPLGMWIHDMSAADPFYVLPVLMGISMFVQFKLNPPPTDPTQAMVFQWMPVMMTVMFLWFPSGLVMYWLTNNVLSIGQQYFIMKKDKAI